MHSNASSSGSIGAMRHVVFCFTRHVECVKQTTAYLITSY